MSQPNPVDAAIAKAEAQAAANAPSNLPQQGQVVDMVPANGTYSAPAPVSLGDLKKGMNVDSFLKLSFYGMAIGNPEPLFQGPIKAKIDMAEFQAFEGLVYGKPPVYIKTFDRITEENGGSWADAMNKARRADPSARSYTGVNISATLLENVAADGKTIAEAGLRIGYSTPQSARANMSKFVEEVTKLGLINSCVDVLIGYEKRTNKDGQKWGGITLELIGEHKS